MKYIVVGAGMSGLAIANILQSHGEEVVVFEKDSRPGGMVKCDVVNGSLFHRTGGHVFNTKRQDVMNWFWNYFDRENEFTKTIRNSAVVFNDKLVVPYPIENHAYYFDVDTQKAFIADLLRITKSTSAPHNFEEFLKGRFGETLYKLYFHPYNYKVWRRDLTKVPLSWLEGKLPMPSVEEMIFNNMNHIEEHQFVHSSFYYAKRGGSQFLADRLAENLTIKYNTTIDKIDKINGILLVNGEKCNRVIFCGNIKSLPKMYALGAFEKQIEDLEAHGTTSVFCEIDNNPYSWVYLPNRIHESHRIICTGNFSETNNADGKMTATVEFTDYISKEDIIDNLNKISFHPKYLAHNFEKYTYPIQDNNTRNMISNLKDILARDGIYLLGRFAEWEYCNMDVAIGSAIDLYKNEFYK
ncbi:protoporphyrinogen/coproporphyrinogen oxidase [Segatella paludivivens]|uniref:protoporphyrinogen/coproporphyrinogen oxidase n=1 Tax=Segatella paludivivens TaxID=185294 RepID=UPI00037CFE37|nr:NAD(P)-binding protein [Segatella paludivivens]